MGGALISSNAAKGAANTQAGAANAATAEQQRQYNQTRQDYAPYRQVGTGALNQLASLYGIQGYQAGTSEPMTYDQWMATDAGQGSIANVNYGGARTHERRQEERDRASNLAYNRYVNQFNTDNAARAATGGSGAGTPDYSAFYNSPDYQFARTEGQRGVEQSAAARGGATSGNALRALSEFNQGLASQQYGNYFSRLSNLAGIGQSASNSVSQAGQNTANNVSNNLLYSGDARASGIINSANAWSTGLSQLGNTFGQFMAARKG